MAIGRLAATRLTTFALALLLGTPLGCGGSGGTDSGTTLFEGPASALVPHETGRAGAFRVTARQGGDTNVSVFTATVTANGADGSFTTRHVAESGSVTEGTSLDLGDEIRVVRFVRDPGGRDEEVVVPNPPVGVVRTPVIAGDPIETGFVRTLEIDVRVGTATERRPIVFTGRARRVPRERGPVRVADATYGDAIRYAVEASGSATIPILSSSVTLRVDVVGDEWFAIGVGRVREDLDVTVRAGDDRTTVTFTTERTGVPPAA
jgi:hypothetical protein